MLTIEAVLLTFSEIFNLWKHTAFISSVKKNIVTDLQTFVKIPGNAKRLSKQVYHSWWNESTHWPLICTAVILNKYISNPYQWQIPFCMMASIADPWYFVMVTSSNGNIFRVTDSLCGEFTGDRWVPRTKTSDTELWCFLWFAPWVNG